MGDERYLDPKTNPFLPQDEDPDLPDPGADGLAPLIPQPEDLAKKIEEIFPGQNEIEAGNLVLEKMASGNYRVKDGQSISDLPLADLMAINDFLKDQRTTPRNRL